MTEMSVDKDKDEELVMDKSCYEMYHQSQTGICI